VKEIGLGQKNTVHEVHGRAKISRLRPGIDRRSSRADAGIDQAVRLTGQGVRVARPHGPRGVHRHGEPVIVVGRAIVGMAMKHYLESVIVTVSPGVVVVLVQGKGNDRHTANDPQE